MDHAIPVSDGQPASNTEGRAIVLFSDGTGNSSAKLFKTNVWRMYEAVDLGPAAEGKLDQISYYDDGVGTSAFKPLAILGGAFGWGLTRNVLDIYRFTCRNYRKGDRIYGFGFSRGAFTMRVAIALIARQGLVLSSDEAELTRRSRDAYREFRRQLLPRKLAWPTKTCRHIRDWLTRKSEVLLGIPPYRQSDNVHPTIRFIGVWDTVAAYGGPIAEITRAIDNWVYPLSMPDYRLDRKVECARHALALDDERDAFQPLLWDEVHEKQLVDDGKVPQDRLEQVWFTGMHADVGGGYPDESLSYVSLLWMMKEAERAKLRTLKTIKKRFVALASSAGPIHDSRRGAAAYYRYQPRKLAAWTEPVDASTDSLRDPAISKDEHRRGLLLSVRVHESVIARIASGTDRYAPINLPSAFEIVPPQVEGETVPQADSEGGREGASEARARPLVDPRLRDWLAREDLAEARGAALEAAWDLVWRRRAAYFVTVLLTLLLLSMGLWVDYVRRPPLLADGRTWIGGVIRLISMFVPDFLGPWVDTYADNAFYFLILAVGIAAVMKYSSRCERRLRDRARHIWREATHIDGRGPRGPVPPPTRLQKFRTAPRYQRSMQIFKWKVLPDVVFAPLMALIGIWLLGGLVTQMTLPLLEGGERLCVSAGGTLPELTLAHMDFSTRATCQSVYARVVRGERYTVTFEVVNDWQDGPYDAGPEGLAAADIGWGLGYLGVPFRRVVKAKYLQPAIEIRQPPGLFRFNAVHIYPLELEQQGDTRVVYRGDFEAERDGELLLFANDAVLPFDLRYFYERSGGSRGVKGNAGTASVTVQRAGLDGARLGKTRFGGAK